MANRREKQHSTSVAPTQVWEQNVKRDPIAHARTVRPMNVNVATTSFGGKFVPLKAFGLLREDSVLNSTLMVNLQMDETAKMLLNPVRISAMAYFIPKLAFERFADMGSIDRSYNGQEEVDGSVIPWFVPENDGNKEFYRSLGLHTTQSELTPNTDYLEAYNTLWNYIAVQRSISLEDDARSMTDGTLAPAFWEHTQMKHVKPKFDDALIDGQVPLNLTGGTRAPVVRATSSSSTPLDLLVDGDALAYAGGSTGAEQQLFAELESVLEGTISLADIDMARETSAWARMRSEYQGISEDWMIDQLMKGIRIRDESLRHPILIDHAETVVGMSQRYATDAANLQESVTDGRTAVPLRLRVPQTTCGGVVLICAQALPEQLYERQRDYYLMAQGVDDLPDRQADELDPQPVAMVTNGEVDESHTNPSGLFGYAPLNHQWQIDAPNLGGRFYRPDPNAPWDEDRNRIWTPEVIDPALGPDFYLSTNLSHEVFKTSTEAPFEWWVNGSCGIEGLTYFGPALRESEGDYDHIIDSVDKSRLKGDGTDDPLNPPSE